MDTTQKPTIEAQGRFWDKWAFAQPRLEGKDDEYIDRACDMIRDVASRCTGDNARAADIGCGLGWKLRVLLEDFGYVYGIDIAEASLEHAAKHAPAARLAHGDFVAMPEADLPKDCDLVVSCEVLAHVEDQPEFLRRVHSMLKPNGRFLLFSQNPTTWSRESHRTEADSDQLRKWLSLKEIRELCDKAGLRIVRTTTLMPHGDQGLLFWRPYANGIIRRIPFVGRARTHRFFEWLGLGRSIVVEAVRDV